jgi:multiple sugar transport system substrate-binding protein
MGSSRTRTGVRRTRARRPASLVVGAALVVLAGCATGTGGDTADVTYDGDAELSGELVVAGFGTGDEVGATRFALAQEALPDVDVQLVEGDLDIQQFLSAVAAEDPPDVINANRNQIGTLAARGAVLPLDDCLEGEGVDPGVYRQSALDQVTLDGTLFGVPEFNQVQVLMANGDLLQAAGLDVADVDGSSWEGVTAAADAMAVTSAGGVDVIGYDSKLPEFLPLWSAANGVRLLSDDGRTAQLDDPAVVEALTFAADVYERQGGFGAVKANRDAQDFFGAENQYATGVLGAMPFEQWYLNVLNEVSPDVPLVVAPFRDREGAPIAYTAGSAWAVPTGSANPEAACRLAVTMTATDTWMAAAQARVDAVEESGRVFTGLLTANDEADERIRAELVPTDAGEPWQSGIDAVYEANDAVFALAANPADAAVTTAWQDAANRVLNGQAEPQESLERAQGEAQDALDAAWEDWDARG